MEITQATKLAVFNHDVKLVNPKFVLTSDTLKYSTATKIATILVKAMREGIELIYNKFLKVLNQEGLQKIETDGENFDTDYHEACLLYTSNITFARKQRGTYHETNQTGNKHRGLPL